MESLPENAFTTSLDDPGLLTELDRRFADQEGNISWDQLRDEN
jgi:hypothetical protein